MVQLTLEQAGVRGADPCIVENLSITFYGRALCICGSTSADSTNCGWVVLYVFNEKNPHISDPCSSTHFEVQLFISIFKSLIPGWYINR